jgi:hypothetical protein
MGLIIAGAVILLLILIALLWVKLSLVYDDGGVGVSVKILFFKITLLGKKEKRLRKRDFKIKKFRRRRKKVIKKYRKKLEKKNKKTAKKTEEKTAVKKKVSKKEAVAKIIDIFSAFLNRFPKYLRIDCARLIIGVGGKDAAAVAVSYGGVVQSVQYVAALLNGVTNFKATDTDKIYVYPDFAEGKWTADISIIMRLRIIHIIKLGIIVLRQYLKQKIKGK